MSKKRNYFFDNAKFILITMVLIGHFLEIILHKNLLARSFYIFIYTFHMPAFVFTAGYFTNLGSSLKKYLSKNIRRLIFPFFILGYYFKKYSLAVRYKTADKLFNKKIAILIFTAQIIIIYLFLNNMDLENLYGASSYFKLNMSLEKALLSRFLFLTTALINILVF